MVLGTAYLYVCVFVDVDNTYGIRYFNVLCCAAVVLLGLMVQLLSHCCAGAGLITPRSDSSRIGGNGTVGSEPDKALLHFAEHRPPVRRTRFDQL